MSGKKSTSALNVFLNGFVVGQLRRESSGAVDFQYDAAWLGNAHAIPVSFSLPLRESRYIGAPVMNVFDNLLPDDESLRKHMAERIGADSPGIYDLLAAAGRDCVGALQFLPIDEAYDYDTSIRGEEVTESEIEEILNNLGTSPLGLKRDDDFRISLAGVQEKTAFLSWRGKWHRPLGTTATTHIFKPQIRSRQDGIDLSDSVENEYLCLKVFEAFGVPVAHARMESFGAKKTLVVERFDRTWTDDRTLSRRPQEDMCQALSAPSSLKYQKDGGPGMADILKFLQGSSRQHTDLPLFVRTQVLFWLLAATDGHAKNFSIHLFPENAFFMTPIYDVLSTQPVFDRGQIDKNQMKLAMSAGKTRHYILHTITPRHFMESGREGGVGEQVVLEIILDIGARASQALARVENTLPPDFPAWLAESILGGFKSRLKIWEQVLTSL